MTSPLRAREAEIGELLARVGVRVGPITWGETSYGRPEAFTVAGVYRISEAMNGGWCVAAGQLSLRDDSGRSNFATIEAAKAAAQADYEARIMSALSTGAHP